MKANYRFLMILVFSAIFFTLEATKPNVYVADFRNECKAKPAYVAQIRNRVIQSLLGTNRVNIFTPDADVLQAMEKTRRDTGNLAGEDLEMMRDLERKGANAIITGSLDGLTVSDKTNEKGVKTYSAVMSITIRVINPQNGQVLKSKTLKYGDPDFGIFALTGKSEEAAVQHAIDKVSAWSIIESISHLQGRIIELEKVNNKKKKVESLYINLGSQDGVGIGHTFYVMLLRTIGGMPSKKQIGTLEVDEVQGPNLSLCKVKKGKEEIFDALNKDQELCVDSY